MSKDKTSYLKQYRWLELDIQHLRDQITLWRARMMSLGSGMPKNNLNTATRTSDSYTVNCIARIEELTSKYEQKISQQLALKTEIEDVINSISDISDRLLLEYRYIHAMRWEEIAVTMHYSYRWVLRKHKRAIARLDTKK